MKIKFQVGRLYQIRFLDHSVGLKKAMEIEAVGWCIKDEGKYAVFTSWQVDDDDTSVVEDNHEPFSIIKSCVVKKRVLQGF